MMINSSLLTTVTMEGRRLSPPPDRISIVESPTGLKFLGFT